MPPLKDKITVGSRVTIAAEAELRGEISIGSGTVIHPRATILALQGPIVIGKNCIVEELAVILNRGPGIMKIGDENLFEVGCRIEAPRMGDHNTFEPKSKVSQTVLLGSFSTVGAACTLTSGISTTTRSTSSEMIEGTELDEILNFDEKPKEKPRVKEEETKGHTIGEEKELEMKEEEEGTKVISKDEEPIAIPKVQEPFSPEQLPDNLVIYGKDSRSRIWSGEGVKQAAALHAKHLSYLQDNIPKFHKLKIIET